MTERVKLVRIVKHFGGVHALRGVDFDCRSGEVHSLIGENGAGKSTLMRVLGGEHRPDAGEGWIEGEKLAFGDPRATRAQGVTVIHQELALAPDLTVAENIFLGELSAFISWGDLKRRARALIERLGFDIDPGRRVGALAVAHQQVVEIAKALSREVKVIVFDEPTAVLSTQDAGRLHRVIAGLRAAGVAVVYISHRLDEVMTISDRVTVMRDGEVVGTREARTLTIEQAIRMMVGRPMAAMFPAKPARVLGEERLGVSGLNSARAGRGVKLRDINLSVRAGEIVGLGGLVGAGRTEVARAIFGADPRDSGEIRVNGRPVRIRAPNDAVKAGLCLVPEDRKVQGAVLSLPIRVNTTMARITDVSAAFGFLRVTRERALVSELGRQLRLKAASIEAPVSSLSGGNQQKVVLAKWFHAGGDAIILDEPTRGVDVGAKAEIYSLIFKLAEEGKAVLVISSEHQELFGLCDRVLVMGEGRLRGQLEPGDYSEEKLLAMAMTNSHDEVRA